MTIQVSKQVTVTIDERDAQTLSTVCELARRWIADNYKHQGDWRCAGEYGPDELKRIQDFLETMFAHGIG